MQINIYINTCINKCTHTRRHIIFTFIAVVAVVIHYHHRCHRRFF